MHHEGTKAGSFKQMYRDETGDVPERRRWYHSVGTLLPHLGKHLPLAGIRKGRGSEGSGRYRVTLGIGKI